MKTIRWNEEVACHLKEQHYYVRSRQVAHGTTLHRQPGLELHSLNRGHVEIEWGRKCFEQSPGGFMLFAADRFHRVTSARATAFVRTVVCLAPSLSSNLKLTGLLASTGIIELRPGRVTVERILGLAEQLHTEQTLRGWGWLYCQIWPVLL